MRLSTKQILILTCIKKGNEDSLPCTVYDIMEGLPYEVKRDATLHSIKILHDKGLVERLGRSPRGPKGTHQTFGLTALGHSLV